MRRTNLMGSLVVLAACSGSGPPPSDAPSPRTADTPAPPEPPAPERPPSEPPAWPEMTREQRKTHMKEVVVPEMKAVFQKQDPERYADFGCPTCHGSGAEEGDFEMPSPELPALDPADRFAAHMEEHPAITQWMMETVVPSMAEALGVPPHDPETGEGFGCFDCHTKVER